MSKEKPINLSYEALGYSRDIAGELIEPKPTPATPAQESLWVQRVADDVDRQFAALPAWKQKSLIEIFSNQCKPQPDSSAISGRSRSYHEGLLKNLADPIEAMAYVQAAIDDSPEAFWKAVKNVAEARDSSSISTEQTFEEWWAENINRIHGLYRGNDLFAFKDLTKECWNAAKGVKQ